MKALLKRIWQWIKDLFHIYEPTPSPFGIKKTALLFAINDYPGSANDLSFCINDIEDVAKRLYERRPEFIIKTFHNQSVTVSNFKKQLRDHIGSMMAKDILLVYYSGHGTQVYDRNGDEADGYDEALYLYDGPLVDDDLGEILKEIPEGAKVILMFDSCFSGTVTKAIGRSIRFHQMEGYQMRSNVRRNIAESSEDLGYVVFSACSENEYSEEGIINGRGNGAFTYYAWKFPQDWTSYAAWFNAIELPNAQFSQNPTIDGRDDLIYTKVFE